MPKVAKASTIHVTVAGIIMGIITLTFANGNTAYKFCEYDPFDFRRNNLRSWISRLQIQILDFSFQIPRQFRVQSSTDPKV